MQLIQELQLEAALTKADHFLAEDMSWDAGRPLDGQLAHAVFQFDAARRALAIANRLTDVNSRRKHRSRIMGMLNKLRASLFRLQDAIEGELEAMQQET